MRPHSLVDRKNKHQKRAEAKYRQQPRMHTPISALGKAAKYEKRKGKKKKEEEEERTIRAEKKGIERETGRKKEKKQPRKKGKREEEERKEKKKRKGEASQERTLIAERYLFAGNISSLTVT